MVFLGERRSRAAEGIGFPAAAEEMAVVVAEKRLREKFRVGIGLGRDLIGV